MSDIEARIRAALDDVHIESGRKDEHEAVVQRVLQAARQAPASGEVEPVEWVDCPVCGEPDMQKTEHERGATLIHCCNHNCASNGGNNSVALAHPPAKVPEGYIETIRDAANELADFDIGTEDLVPALFAIADRLTATTTANTAGVDNADVWLPFGAGSAYADAKERPSENMQISSNLVVELIDEIYRLNATPAQEQ